MKTYTYTVKQTTGTFVWHVFAHVNEEGKQDGWMCVLMSANGNNVNDVYEHFSLKRDAVAMVKTGALVKTRSWGWCFI